MLDLDEALERFHAAQPEYAWGLSNHGPMAAEALGRIGHAALRMAFVDRYAPRLAPLAPGRPIPSGEQTAALGRIERFADWLATLERELDGEPWRDVLGRRAREWCDGLFAAAGHGWLRTAHAVRALEEDPNPIRLRELAHGLAYWAARHQRLPGVPGRRPARIGAAELLGAVPLVPENARRSGLFTHAVLALEAHPAFAEATDSLAPETSDVARTLHELCVGAAELYLAHPEQRIAYVHVLTVPSALRLLAPHLDAATLQRALAYGAQAAAALHAVSGLRRPDAAPPADEVEKLADDPAEIRYRAACSLEEHAIKLAEAALREDALREHRALRLAAADAALHLGPSTRC
jgi:hypothetical protein